MPQKRVLIVLAGTDMPADDRRRWAEKADVIVAADAGADRLAEAGLRPKVIVGDMDSISAKISGDSLFVKRVDESTTDFEKALVFCDDQYPDAEVLAICSEGDAFDHEITSFQIGARWSTAVNFGLRKGLCLFLHAGKPISLRLAGGARVSMLPLTECHGVEMSGVRWPLTDAKMHPLGKHSISNEADDTGQIRVGIRSGTAALFFDVEIGTWPSELLLP